MNNNQQFEDIAIIGMSCRFPGAKNIDEYWSNLVNGTESISKFTKKELIEQGIPPLHLESDKYVRSKGYLEDCDYFDADFFGYPPRDAMKMDPQIRLLHECSHEALESASYNLEKTEAKVGAFFGANENQAWLNMLNDEIGPEPSEQYDTFILNFREYTATRVAHNMNLNGPAFTVLTACSTSLVAVHLACQSIQKGETDMALAGGASLTWPMKAGYDYRDGLMVSQDGHCRTFDKNASGTVFGDGVGVVVLKRLDAALQDGDHIHAVIKGSAINNDGNDKIGYTAPSQTGQEAVVKTALKSSGVDPKTVGYLEAHGTATMVGDPIEANALVNSYGPTEPGFRKIGSVKTNIGHVNVAAGAAALIKVALSLENQKIPPHLNFNQINPEINYSPEYFTVGTELTDFKGLNAPQRAGVSAFGFGGTNAHMILEAPPSPETVSQVPNPNLITISGRSNWALQQRKKDLESFLSSHSETNIGDLALSLNEGRKHFKYRTHVVASHIDELISKLQKQTFTTSERSDKKIAFLFPGQGSQYVGMGKDLYEQESVFKDSLNACEAIIQEKAGFSLLELIFPKNWTKTEEARLAQTQFAQPAIFSISYSMAKLLQSWSINPHAVVGHSVGEYVAACLSGVFTLEEALTLIATRGKLIQQQPSGDMLAVTLSEKELKEYLSEDLSLAAVNAPSLSVISGASEAIGELQQLLKEKGIVAQSLKTSHPFHSHLMEPVLDEFELAFKEVVVPKSPKIDMISTVTGKVVRSGILSSADYWRKNIRQPVLFSRAVHGLIKNDDYLLLEVGPGNTLTGLIKMNKNAHTKQPIFPTLPSGHESGADAKAATLNAIGGLWQNGFDPDWFGLRVQGAKRIPLPTYPFERQKFSPSPKKAEKSQREAFVKNPDLKEWFYTPTWKRSIKREAEIKFKGIKNWLIFSTNNELSDQVHQALKGGKQRVYRVYKGDKFEQISDFEYVIDSNKLEDYGLLFERLQKLKKLPHHVIHLWDYSIGERKKGDYQGFHSLLFFAQTLGKYNYIKDLNLTVVTDQAYQVIGNEAVNHRASELIGPIKVIPQEFSNVSSVHLDLKDDDCSAEEMAEKVINETVGRMEEQILAYRNGHRWVQEFEKHPIDKTKSFSLRKDAVILLTGGLGGLGLVMAEFFCQHSKPVLIFTSRSKFPAQKDWETYLKKHPVSDITRQKIKRLKRLIKKGARVHFIQSDIADLKKMKAGIAKAEKRFGSITGVVHAAGIPGEGIMQLREPKDVEKVMLPKIEGTDVLMKLFKAHELDYMLFCSSIASVLGGVGLTDYCSANHYMDSIAANTKLKGAGNIVSVGWDMWGETGMGLKTYVPKELKEWFDNELKNGITSKEGQEILKRILGSKGSPIITISTRDLQRKIDLWIKREFFKERDSQQAAEENKPKFSRPELTMSYVKPTTDTEKRVAKNWENLFGIDKIGRHDNFFEIGGHSLLATILVNKLRKEFSKNLSIRDIMDNPTVAEIATIVDKK